MLDLAVSLTVKPKKNYNLLIRIKIGNSLLPTSEKNVCPRYPEN